MIALVWIVVIVCGVTGVTARPNATTTPGTHPTAPHTTTNTTTKPTTPPMSHNRPQRCPTKAALIADFISKSKYHFKALQYEHKGYYDALKWNLDGAFKSLEGQFGNLISDVQYDMKNQFTTVQKQNDAQKSENAALKSQLNHTMSAMKEEVTNLKNDLQHDMKNQYTNVQKQIDAVKSQNNNLKSQNDAIKSQNDNLKSQNDDIKSQNDNLKSQNDAIKSQNDDLKSQNDAIKSQNDDLKSQNNDIKSQNTALKSQLTQTLSAVKDEMKSQNTAIKQQMTDGLKTLTDHVTEQNCAGGWSMNGVCYKIVTCSPGCKIATAKQMCSNIGATLAPLRSATIYNVINAHRKQLGINQLWIDGSDAVTEGTWRYHDGTLMSYTHWASGQPNDGTSANNVNIYDNKMWDEAPSTALDGVACAWE